MIVSASYMEILSKSVREEHERELQIASISVEQESKVIIRRIKDLSTVYFAMERTYNSRNIELSYSMETNDHIRK